MRIPDAARRGPGHSTANCDGPTPRKPPRVLYPTPIGAGRVGEEATHERDPIPPRFLSQLRNFLRQSWLLHRSRSRRSCGYPSTRSGICIQAVFSSSYRFMSSVRPLRSTGVTPLLRYYGPIRLPITAASPVMSSRRAWLAFARHRAGPPRLLDGSFHARCPQPPRKVPWLLLPVASPRVLSGFILVGGLAPFVFLSRPNRVHLRYGSRVRLPTPAPSLGLALVRLHAEQAIYMVNSFPFTRSARLILAYRPSGSAPRGREARSATA